jgi:hypothetical protein
MVKAVERASGRTEGRWNGEDVTPGIPKHTMLHVNEKDIRKRKPVKTVETGGVDPDLCNEQFENLEKLRADYEKMLVPAFPI